MKVILTGATGFIGSAVLQRFIQTPKVTSIVVLSRRELPVQNEKVSVTIVKDFHNYDESIRSQISDAQACIWCLGQPRAGLDIHLELPLAAAKAFQESVLPSLSKGAEFRFVYTSGAAVVRDQKATVLLLSETRKGRGRCEQAMIDLEDQNKGSWKTYVVRPAVVTNGQPMLIGLIGGWYIPNEELAAAMVDIAINGADEQTIGSAKLRAMGQALLAQA